MTASPFEQHLGDPRGAGRLARPTHVATREDPACGDRLTVEVEVVEGRIGALAWTASGCAGTLAAASALATLAPGRPVGSSAVTRAELDAALGGLPPARRHALRLAVATLTAALAGSGEGGGG
jgi:NifU-like protein involved in Fe-S cluster formation